VLRDTVGICVEEAKEFRPDMVIGIGGGSCLDFAKCATLLLSHGGKLQDYYGEFGAGSDVAADRHAPPPALAPR
jgi:alcohol dehydrogenase